MLQSLLADSLLVACEEGLPILHLLKIINTQFIKLWSLLIKNIRFDSTHNKHQIQDH